MERKGSAVIDVLMKKDSLLVYVLKFFVNLADRRSEVLRERD